MLFPHDADSFIRLAEEAAEVDGPGSKEALTGALKAGFEQYDFQLNQLSNGIKGLGGLMSRGAIEAATAELFFMEQQSLERELSETAERIRMVMLALRRIERRPIGATVGEEA